MTIWPTRDILCVDTDWSPPPPLPPARTGGFLPSSLPASSRYATLCVLAGVEPADDPPVAPLAVDLQNTTKNIYGERSFPPLDGVDVMPFLLAPATSAPDAAHEYLVLSKEVVVAGKWKLLVSQPAFKTQNSGWKDQNGTWRAPNATEIHDCIAQNHAPGGAANVLPIPKKGGHACLFDLRADPGEHVDVSQSNLDVVVKLTAALNLAVLTQRDCSGWTYKASGSEYDIPGPLQPDGTKSCSPPKLIGHCDAQCANLHWKKAFGVGDGPICGLDACANSTEQRAHALE